MYFPLPFYGREFAALLADVRRRVAARFPDRETVAAVGVVLAVLVLAGTVFALDVPSFTPPRVA